jgi:aminopeptidase N
MVLPDTITPSHYDLTVTPDAAAATFTAVVRIAIDVHQRTRDIKLNAAELAFSRVQLSGTTAAPVVSFDTTRQTATLHFPAAIAPGPHLLSIRYSGHIGADPAGLFYLDYDSSTGRKRALYTQLENSDARRVFPCWDEPNRKATFTLTVIAPVAQMVVSNMPAAHVDQQPGGRASTTFQTSPKMSTYLLFMAVGDFERITRKVNGVEVGVVFKRGDAARAAFGLDALAQILPYYEEYFGVRYPLPKLDLVSGPGQSQHFAAMENWGAIFGFDAYLLVDPAVSSQSDRITVFHDIAHEMAHQWFGDLVTMDWWTDLWLNEGFAEWMEYKATDHFHPEWQVWLSSLMERETAFDLDARAGTHPIITPIADVLQADSDFDEITYSKGMAVIRMLENYVGEQAFRDGIRRYLRAHEYANAVSDDLWRELDRTSPVPVSGIAHEFTLQAGIPLIRVTDAAGIHLQQGRFTIDASAGPTVWQVPVIVQPPAGPEWRGLVSATTPVTIPKSQAAGAVVNAGQYGYFRTLYTPALIATLSTHFGSLKAIDEMGLLQDACALGLAGYEPLPDVLSLAQHVDPHMAPQVQQIAASTLTDIAFLYRGLPGEAGFRAYAKPVLERLLAGVGWDPAPGENGDIKMLRVTLIGALSSLDDEEVVRQARERFERFVHDPGSLQPDLRREVVRVVAVHADAAAWEQLHDLARSARSGIEKDRYFGTLGLAEDPKLAQRALELTLTDEMEPTTRPNVIDAVSGRHPDMAFEFAVAHRSEVNAWLEPDTRNVYQTRLLSLSTDPAALPKLKAYVQAYVPVPTRRTAEAAESEILYRLKIRNEQLPQIDAWLKRPGG